MNIDRDRIHSTLLLVGCNPETLCALWLNAEDQLKKHLTNQGGGGADGEVSVENCVGPFTPDSAAAASFEERVKALYGKYTNLGQDHPSHGGLDLMIRRALKAEGDLSAKEAEIARLKSEGVEYLIRQRDEARREAAARAKTITRMGEDAETATKEYWEIRHDRDALKAALDEAKAMYVVASDDRTRLRAKLDVAEKECDRARLILGAYDSLDGGYGSRDWIQFHDARRSASRAKESDHA